MTHKIAVISDTHGILRPEVAEKLKEAELILHGGDIADEKTLEKLRQIAKVTAVRGNADKDWAEGIPAEVFVELYGKKICMVHNKKHFSQKAGQADIAIFGHSHRYEEKIMDGALWLNPGSCGPRRFNRPLTMAMLEFSDPGDVLVRRIEILADGSSRCQSGCRWDAAAGAWAEPEDRGFGETDPAALQPDFSTGELAETVIKIVRDIERGKSVEQITKAHKVSRELAEQICQIYFTHPGIDADGVLRKMEIAGL